MTDYPLLALGGYETYQLAHIATYVAGSLGRHRRSVSGRGGRAARAEAVRDLAGAATALSNATGTTVPDEDLPRPLDRDTFSAAQGLVTSGPRTADVVALDGVGQRGFAVLGQVPGIGAVGARVADPKIAEALRTHFLTQPVADLAVWAVTQDPHRVPTLPRQVDLAAFVEHLDPGRDGDRAVARNLRGQDRRIDAAIRGRFTGVELDAPFVVAVPPGAGSGPADAAVPTQRWRRGGAVRRLGPRPAASRRTSVPAAAQRAAVPNVPSTNAGP